MIQTLIRREGRALARRCACSALVAVVVLAVPGCAGALYGGAAGAYAAAGTGSCQTYNGSWETDGGCGSADAVFLLGAVVVGATVGAIIEFVRWVCDGTK